MSTLLARNDLVAFLQALRREDVGLLAIFVFQISAMKAVRFGSYSSRSTVAGTSNLRRLGSMIRITPLMAAAAPARRDPAGVVAAALLGQPSVSALTGLPFHKLRPVDLNEPPLRRRVGLKVFSAIVPFPNRRHHRPDDTSIECAFGQRHDRFFDVLPAAHDAAEPLGLALLATSC